MADKSNDDRGEHAQHNQDGLNDMETMKSQLENLPPEDCVNPVSGEMHGRHDPHLANSNKEYSYSLSDLVS